ncbi:sensor domain-containing diguanylate cyclase [Cryptosporangium phraense]|uniref:Diguanylate cyclase n=1 Tax=Cryptosporangium phraense TaxID=2593070 RepID=A0A545ALI2_9ACTN|nr:GGDEF domain-containing protein [Cryptosporangium phraense]TQS42120.1 diguanylate cyclase [Cryptosporangium phraense]
MRTVPRAWMAFAGFGLAAILVYRAGSLAGMPELAQKLVYWTVDVGAVVALLVGVRLHKPEVKAPWLLFAAGQASSLGADLTYYGSELVGVELPYPSPADALYLAQYVFGGLALLLFIRRRTPGWDLPALIDATIVAVSAALLAWVYLISPGYGHLSTLGTVTAAAYPVGDLVLLSVGARLMLGGGARPVALRFVGAFLVLVLVPDALYAFDALNGGYTETGWLESLWLTSWVLLGTAGLHPSMRELSTRSPVAAPDATIARMVILAAASLLAPATLYVQYVRGAPLHVPLVAAVCATLFLLVLIRMGMLVAAQRRVAVTDGLTGLATRRHFEHSLEQAARRADGLAVLLLDVDLFKAVNDTYGHHGGDRVLGEIANRLRASVRPGDLVARYGGEEFALLLPHITPREARQVAERVHEAIRRTPIDVGGGVEITVTASVGIATLPVDAPTGDALVRLADQLLYRAKEAGRDRVAAGASLSAVSKAS